MATSVSAGSSATVTLPAGSVLALTGSALVNVSGVKAGSGFMQEVSGRSVLGPFDAAATVSITATGNGMVYDVTGSQAARVKSLSADYTLSTADDGLTLSCSAALTITVPSGLSPMPSVIVWPPSSGNASVARGGSATLNGASTTLTRSLSSNPIGFAIAATPAADAYGVSGS